MQTVPTNVGATIKRTLSTRPADSQVIYYVRDDHGVWHYWNFSGEFLSIPSDRTMIAKTEETGNFEIVSEGYVPPIPEPEGLGAVVEVESSNGVKTRYVRSDEATDFDPEPWSEVPFADTWVDWDYLRTQSNLRVLSEGV